MKKQLKGEEFKGIWVPVEYQLSAEWPELERAVSFKHMWRSWTFFDEKGQEIPQKGFVMIYVEVISNPSIKDLAFAGDQPALYWWVGGEASSVGINWSPGVVSQNPERFFTIVSFNEKEIVIQAIPANKGRWIGQGGKNVKALSEKLGLTVRIV